MWRDAQEEAYQGLLPCCSPAGHQGVSTMVVLMFPQAEIPALWSGCSLLAQVVLSVHPLERAVAQAAGPAAAPIGVAKRHPGYRLLISASRWHK